MTELLAPFLETSSRTYWPALVIAGLIAAIYHRGRLSVLSNTGKSWVSASSRLDIQLLLGKQALRLLLGSSALALGTWLAIRGVIRLDGWLGRPDLQAPAWLVVGSYTVATFLAWDLSRYLVHRLMHAVPALWAFHQVHHSAEVLTPLTFHRVHPVESLLYQVRGVGITAALATVFFWLFRDQATPLTVLGVHSIGFVLTAVSGNLRHSHVWWRFGRLERWLVSPAQHQLHHALDPVLQQRNFGTWLAVWDRWLGTWMPSPETAPELYGVVERNHGNSLVSAWIGPFLELGRRGAPLLLLVAPGVSWGQEEIIVYAEDGVTRVAGSAHVIDEEELERFEYDDIQQIVRKVPGVYVRGEDGFGLRPNIGMRGANSDRSAKITLLEDGVLLAPAPYAAPAAYYFPMSTRMVGVEVFKGPSATLHGPQTVGGALNLMTRDIPLGSAARVDLAQGLRGTSRAHAWGGSGDEDRGVLVEAAHLSSHGFKDLDGGGPTGFRRSELMLKGRAGAVDVKLGYSHERSNETYLGLSRADFEQTPYRRYAASSEGLMRWHRTQAELGWTAEVGPVELRTVAYHHALSREWRKFNRFVGGPDLHTLLQADEPGAGEVYLAILRGEEDSATPEQQLRIGTNDRRFHAAGLQTRGTWNTRAGRVSSRLQFGARVHYDDVVRRHSEDPFEMQSGALMPTGEPTEVLLDSHASALALAVHAHEDLQIGRLHLLPGLRSETIRTERDGSEALRSTVLPGLAVLGEVAHWLDLFVGVHEGFSPVAPGADSEVRPELSWNWETGLRLGEDATEAELVGYLNDYQNVTGQCTLSGGCAGDLLDQQFNGGKALVYGLEAAVSHQILLPKRLSLPLSANYTLTRSAFRTSFASGFPQFGQVTAGDALPYVPVHQGMAQASLSHRRFALNLGGSWRTGMLDQAGRFEEGTQVPALFLLDASAQARFGERVELYATATNVLGVKAIESWRPFGARPVAPFMAMIGLKLTPVSRESPDPTP